MSLLSTSKVNAGKKSSRIRLSIGISTLAFALILGGCSTFESRTDAEISYLSYLDSYQLNAPAMVMIRDAWPLQRTEQSYQRIVNSLTPLSMPLGPIDRQQKSSEADQQVFNWVKAQAFNGSRLNKKNNGAVTHYALMVWLGYGEYSQMTREQRDNKAISLLKQINKRDAYSEYLAGVIELGDQPADALVFLERSAAYGYAPAQAALARLYQGNDGVPRNDKKARTMLSKLAKNKQTDQKQKAVANAWLSAMSFYGIGSKVNSKAAQQYIKKAQTSSELMYLQALMLSEGLGYRPDSKKANDLLVKSSKAGSGSAANELALNHLNGRGVDVDTRMARVLFKQAADQGSIAASYNLGLDSLYGNSAPANITDASLWFQRAAAQGSVQSQRSLTYLMLDDQRWYDFSSDKAASLRAQLQKTAEQGDSWSSYALGLLILRGQGGIADIQTGYAWLNIAVALGYRQAAQLRDASGLQMSRPELERAQSLSQTFFDRIELAQGSEVQS